MLQLDSISKRHGGQILFLEASAAVQRGEKVGLVGPNGAGKSTIFRLLMKEEEPDDGRISIDRGVTLGYFSQTIGEMKGQSVLEATIAGAGAVSEAAHRLHELELALADPAQADHMDKLVERYGEAQALFESLGGYGLEARAHEVLAGLGFSPEQVAGDVGLLSGGWKTRVGLARILVMRPDALLLDEPTNHLDLESILWLEQWLRDFDGALILTTHDREFMNRIVTKIVAIDGGDITSYSGNYDFYESQRKLAEREQEAQYARQQAMLAKEEAFIARFKARASHASQVQSRIKKIDKIEKVEPP
ncbi:ATP-binding cassette domain-containing protein, partial [Myxococcota bacterium]|nr:ATP-binding cassette domain-containing protein [Myxococcota bacterium]